MQDTQPNPQDPVSLPEDIFFHSLSFLSPFSLATSSSISKLWRRSILSNPTLHTEVDLSRMGKSSTMRLVVATLTRLCRLSNNQVRTLRLNLTCFPVHVDGVKDRKLRDSCLDLLVQIIQDSKDSLEEMTVLIDPDESRRDNMRRRDDKVDETVIFLLRLFHKLETKGIINLQTITISAAGWFTLKVQKQDSISSPSTDPADSIQEKILLESLEVIDHILELGERGRNIAFSILLKKMKIMSGGNGLFTEFNETTGEEDELPEWDAKRILQELVSSSSTLQSLRLSFIGPQIPRASWEFSMRCPRLTCLEVSVFEDEESQEQDDEFHDEDEIQFLKFPERVDGMKHLKELILHEGDFSIDWAQASKWMGNQIEHLELNGKIQFTDQLRILKNSSSTLRVIRLQGGHRQNDLNFKSTLLIPNLEKLSLHSVNPSILSLFSNISSSKLISVEFTCHSSVQAQFDCLRKLIEKHCSSLIDIKFWWWNDKLKPPVIPSSTESLTFSRLQSLDITETNGDLVRWASKFRYPELSSLGVKEGHKSALKGDLRRFMRKEKLLEERET